MYNWFVSLPIPFRVFLVIVYLLIGVCFSIWCLYNVVTNQYYTIHSSLFQKPEDWLNEINWDDKIVLAFFTFVWPCGIVYALLFIGLEKTKKIFKSFYNSCCGVVHSFYNKACNAMYQFRHGENVEIFMEKSIRVAREKERNSKTNKISYYEYFNSVIVCTIYIADNNWYFSIVGEDIPHIYKAQLPYSSFEWREL